MTLHKSLIISATLVTLLTGCGGSSDSSSGISQISYSGVKTPATISADNSEELASSSAAVTNSLVSNENTDALPFGISTNNQSVKAGKMVNSLINNVRSSMTESSNLPIGITEEQVGSCGGTATGTGSESKFKVTFNNYCDEGVTINGTVTTSYSESSSSWSTKNITLTSTDGTMTFSGKGTCTYTETSDTETETCNQSIKVTANGITNSASFTEVCVTSYSPSYQEICTESEFIKADNGKTYQVEDSSVEGDNTNGWDVEGTFYDPKYGSVDFDASDIQYCDNGNIQSGSITLTDESNNRLFVTFPNCDEMTITFNGSATTVNQ